MSKKAKEALKMLKELTANEHNTLGVYKVETLKKTLNDLIEENEKQEEWIRDLQSGMYINCVYCGYRYGPKDEVPESMSDVLKRHIEICPKHPMSKLKKENDYLKNKK